MTTPTTLPVGATAIVDRATGNELKPNADGSLNIGSGGGGGTQYTDGATPPANPIGGAIQFDNNGTWNDAGADHPLPVSDPNSATIAANTANNTNIGASADAAVVGDNAGSLSAKLRGLTKMINDMWDSTNHWLQIKVMNANANGQATMLNSAPVVIASDQSNVPVLQKNATWTSIYTTTVTNQSTWAGSGDISVASYSQIMITIQLSALTGTSIQFFGGRKDSFGNYPNLWNPSAITTSNGASNTSWGPGLSTNHAFGSTIRLIATLVSVTNVSFTIDIQGR